jgi:hypothetical protein
MSTKLAGGVSPSVQVYKGQGERPDRTLAGQVEVNTVACESDSECG